MNIFVAVKWKRPVPALELDRFLPFLVREPEGTTRWCSEGGGAEIVSFCYWGHLIALPYLVQRPDAAITFDGLPLKGATSGDRPMDERSLWQASSGDFRNLEGEFSIVEARDDRVLATSNVGGGHPIYYIETPQCVAFSNRSVLLLQLPGASTELSLEALRWLPYHSHMVAGATPFRDVKQLIGGDSVSYSVAEGFQYSPQKFSSLVPVTNGLEPLQRSTAFFETHADRMAAALKQVQALYENTPLSLGMSGGKDSRLILALLVRAGLTDNLESLFTNGPLYLHDVLSAQDVCGRIGLRHHTINRPPMVHGSADVHVGRLMTSLNLTEGRLATHYQVTPRNYRGTIALSGQQAVRDSHYRHCPTQSPQAFVDCVMRSHFHDPAGLLHPRARRAADRAYRAIFERYFDEGMALDSMAEYYMLRERHAGWTSMMLHASSHAGPTANALLFPAVYNVLFQIPANLRREEFYHFMVIRACAPELLDVPFANQHWSLRLKEELEGIVDVPVVRPYVNHQSFPNMSNPYKPAHKVAAFNSLKPAMQRLMERNAHMLREDFALEEVERLLAHDTDLPVPRLLCASGLYTALLVIEYGVDLFHRSRSEEIGKELEASLHTRAMISVPCKEEQFADALRRHDQCIHVLSRDATKKAERRGAALLRKAIACVRRVLPRANGNSVSEAATRHQFEAVLLDREKNIAKLARTSLRGEIKG